MHSVNMFSCIGTLRGTSSDTENQESFASRACCKLCGNILASVNVIIQSDSIFHFNTVGIGSGVSYQRLSTCF